MHQASELNTDWSVCGVNQSVLLSRLLLVYCGSVWQSLSVRHRVSCRAEEEAGLSKDLQKAPVSLKQPATKTSAHTARVHLSVSHGGPANIKAYLIPYGFVFFKGIWQSKGVILERCNPCVLCSLSYWMCYYTVCKEMVDFWSRWSMAFKGAVASCAQRWNNPDENAYRACITAYIKSPGLGVWKCGPPYASVGQVTSKI